MIEFTIKTLDSNNHHFSVEDETTVEQLKERIRERLGIEAHLQRLIFYGRVLQDDKRLMDIDVNGKVLHLVQRPPPSPRSRQPRTNTSNASNTTTSNTTVTEPTAVGMQQQIRRLMALTGPPDYLLENQQQFTLSPTAGRLEFMRRTVAEIKTTLIRLTALVNREEYSGASGSSEVPVEQMDNELDPETTQDEPEEPLIDDNGDLIPENESRAQHTRRRSYRAMRALRVRHTRPRDFAQLLDDLIGLQQQFAPHRDNYIRMLRAASVTEHSQMSEEEREHEQRFVDLVSDIMHSFGHAYHAAAEINFHVGMRIPRLTSEPVPPRHPIPVQAHVHIIQDNRRVPQQANNTNTPPTNNTGASAPSTVTSANATVTSNMETGDDETRNSQTNAQTGNTTSTSNDNVNDSDPITYQVEIETRVPIAVPIDNVVLAEMANVAAASNLQQQQNDQNQGQQQSNNQQGQGNRRQVQLDFEDIFRGLNQAGWFNTESGMAGMGVEVLMSMEEIPTSGSGNNGGQQNLGEGGVYIAPMSWGGPQGSEMLQGIIGSMIRQGLMPEGVALQVTGPIPEQLRNQTTSQTQNQPQPQPQPQATTNTQANREQTAQNQPRQSGVHLRRAASTTRARAHAVNNWVYDRYLNCDAMFARRHAQRRRLQYQRQVVAHERLRSMRTEAQNIETLRERVPSITHDHMTTMIALLNNNSLVPATWLNAFLVSVARHLFLADAMSPLGSEPPLVPHEFLTLRLLLRNYVQDLITRSECTDGENAFQAVADFLVDEHAEFINNVGTMTPVVPGVNILESIRALARSRLPAVIATVMSDSAGEVAATRFYGVIFRVFMDLCGLVAFVCLECGDGLRAIYTAFVEQLVQDFDVATRQLFITLSNENLNGVFVDLRSHREAVCQFIRYHDEFFDNDTMFPEQVEPMEVSPSHHATDETMQATLPAMPCPIHRPLLPGLDHSDTPNDDDNTESASTSSVKSAEADTETEAETEAEVDADAENDAEAEGDAEAETTAESTAESEADPVEQPAESSVSNGPAKSTNDDKQPGVENTNMEQSEDDSPPNIQIVSPLMIMQHWSEEWVPVISHDQEAQSEEPPEPYSDAYLSGMPAKKRRCIRQSRPPTTLDGFMNESAREAVSRTAPMEDNSALRSAFREHMRNMALDRSAVSGDYDPLRYASAARFLGPRMMKRQSSDTTGEKSDK